MIIVNIANPALRAACLLLLIILLCSLSWFVTTTAIGDGLIAAADRLPEITQADRLSAADNALGLAYSDPSVHFRRGLIYRAAAAENTSSQEVSAKYLTTAVESLQRAAQMQPEDYRIWLSLGRSLEMSEQVGLKLTGPVTDSRLALERAIQLAPRHFDPRWQLGNQLLRAGKPDEALKNLRVSLANRPQSVPLIFNSVWDALQGDTAAVMRTLNPPVEARAQIAALLVWRKKVSEAMGVWKDAIKSPENTQHLIDTLLVNQFYKTAFELWKEAGLERVPVPDTGSLLANGSFEEEIDFDRKTPFLIWQVTPRTGVNLSLDSKQRHAGKHSLRLSFETKDSASFEIAHQVITVLPATRYQLSFAALTQDLKSFSIPLIQVQDPADPTRLTSTASPFEITSDGWREVHLDFTTSAQTEAIIVRIIRLTCADSPCPLSGQLWLDDFKLAATEK